MSLTTDDLASGLSMLLLFIAVVGVVVSISITRARRRGSTTLALDVTRNAAWVYVWFMAVAIVFAGVQILANAGVFLSDSVFMQVQSQEHELTSSACLDSFDGAGLLCGVQVGPIPFGIRMLVFLGTVLSIVASAAVAWAIYTATRRAGEREPFHPSVSRTFGVMAIVVMVSAVLGDLVQQIGMTLAARSLDWSTAAAPIRFDLSIVPWPFAVAVGLFAMSAIFRYGAQLQREREQLRRDTEGLV